MKSLVLSGVFVLASTGLALASTEVLPVDPTEKADDATVVVLAAEVDEAVIIDKKDAAAAAGIPYQELADMVEVTEVDKLCAETPDAAACVDTGSEG